MEFALSHDGQDAPKQPPRRIPRLPNEPKASEPGWAQGLRNLYDSVANEALPETFDDLLKKLDKDHGD